MARATTAALFVAAALVAPGIPVGHLGATTALAATTEVATSPLAITTAAGRHIFSVELALTPEERATGLMNRKSLAADRGMLFDMGRVGPAAFWMKNTFVSLDIIFIDAEGRVVNVAERTTPLSEALVPSDGPVRYVLELVAGSAERIGLQPGDRVEHALIQAP